MRACRVIAGLLALLLTAPLVAQAADPRPNPHLKKAKLLYRRLHYGRVVRTLERALKVKGNTHAQLCEIYSLMGTVHVVLENEPAAHRAFKKLLAIEPGYALGPDVSPKIVDLFNRVKREMAPPMKFLGKPKTRTRPGKYPQVMVAVEDPGRRIGRVNLYCQDPRGKFLRKAMQPGKQDRYLGTFPVKPEEHPEGYRLSYFVQAVGADDRPLESLGSRDKPLIFTILPRPVKKPEESPAAVAGASPWYKQWWIWAAAGVAVVGLSVGIGVAAGGSEDVPIGTLGKLTLD